MLKKCMIVAAMAAFAGVAQAELVNNGGFETGDFSGWTQFGDTSFTNVWSAGSHSGTYNAFFGPLDPGGIEQTLTAAAGSQIQVSLWALVEDVDVPNSLLVTLDGQVVVSLVDYTTTDWAQFSNTITVANANPVLRIEITNPADYYDIDDVSATLVPTPGAMALLGLGGLVAARRRRH